MNATVTPIVNAMAAKATNTDVIEAMRSVQTEADQWRLAEALASAIPNGGASDFAAIVDEAKAAGVSGGLSAKTLQLYRDAAKRWPADKRVANLSFSAHRETMALEGDIASRVKLLTQLVKSSGGADKVTVQTVRQAVRVANGKPPKDAPTPADKAEAEAQRTTAAVLADIMAGAPQLLSAINARTTRDDLDKLNKGFAKALAHVERLQAKQAAAAKRLTAPRKPAGAAKATAGKPVAKKAPAKAPAARKPAGDLRGL